MKYLLLAAGMGVSLAGCNLLGAGDNAAGTLADLPPVGQATEAEMSDNSGGVTELMVEVIEEGSGSAATAGQTVSVHYTGTLLDGTKFDSSVDRGEPIEFELGAGRVIQGWDQGLEGMKVGTKAKLTIPSGMAYGDRSPSPAIPPKRS